MYAAKGGDVPVADIESVARNGATSELGFRTEDLHSVSRARTHAHHPPFFCVRGDCVFFFFFPSSSFIKIVSSSSSPLECVYLACTPIMFRIISSSHLNSSFCTGREGREHWLAILRADEMVRGEEKNKQTRNDPRWNRRPLEIDSELVPSNDQKMHLDIPV